jgi:drug/metabolite transporter (DMT)-like permease
VLLRPDTPNGEYAATLIGLLSGLLTALAYFNVGKLVRSGEPELRVVFYFSLVGTLVGGMMTSVVGFTALDSAMMLCVCAIGVFGSLGQITMTRAYGSGNAVIVSILSYSTIIFSTLLGYLLFGEKLSYIAAGGMALIIFLRCVGDSETRSGKNLEGSGGVKSTALSAGGRQRKCINESL